MEGEGSHGKGSRRRHSAEKENAETHGGLPGLWCAVEECTRAVRHAAGVAGLAQAGREAANGDPVRCWGRSCSVLRLPGLLEEVWAAMEDGPAKAGSAGRGCAGLERGARGAIVTGHGLLMAVRAQGRSSGAGGGCCAREREEAPSLVMAGCCWDCWRLKMIGLGIRLDD